MKRKVVFIFAVVMSMLLCACGKACDCECGCDTCTCSKKESEENVTQEQEKELTQEDLEAYAKGKEYKGTLRKDGVIIGTISENKTTMKVSHRGGAWTVDYTDGYKQNDSAWAVIADNETPDDFTDDIFVGFIKGK